MPKHIDNIRFNFKRTFRRLLSHMTFLKRNKKEKKNIFFLPSTSRTKVMLFNQIMIKLFSMI